MPNLHEAQMVYRGSQEALEAWCVVGGSRKLVWSHPTHFVQVDGSKLSAEIRRRFGDTWKTIEKYPYESVYVEDSAAWMFNGLQSVRTLPSVELGKRVQSVTAMFQNCSSLQAIPLLDTAKVTDVSFMFAQCSSLQAIPLLDTTKVTTMRATFAGCSSLQAIPLLDTAKVTTMETMFQNCSSLQAIPLLDTAKVETMQNMFFGCSSLQAIPQLNTAKVTTMEAMFAYCSSLQALPPLDCRRVETFKYTFYDCTQLESFELVGARVGFDFSRTKVGISAAQRILDRLGTPDGAQTIKAPASARGVDTSGAEAKGWTVVFP